MPEEIVTEKKDAGKVLIADLVALATTCDIPGDALNEEIEGIKKQEAHAINRSGIERQLQEIARGYGPTQTHLFIAKIEGIILDNARQGKTVCCSECDSTEFLAKAQVRGKQQYVCRECVKAGK